MSQLQQPTNPLPRLPPYEFIHCHSDSLVPTTQSP